MPLPLHRRTIAVLSCFIPCFVHAQTQYSQPAGAARVSQLDEIVVSASRQAEPLAKVRGDVSVINREELQRAGADSVAQILSRHHGIQAAASGGPQSQTSVYLRGANAQHTLVLIDGVRMNSSIQGGFNWPALDPAIIERIEIVRGAASSLYGSDALGGVINIITRRDGKDRPLEAWMNVGLGSQSTFKSSAGVSGAQEGWDYNLSTSLSDSDGFSATNADSFSHHPDSDGYSQHGFSGSVGRTWRDGHRIGFTAYNNYLNADEDGGLFADPAYSVTRQQGYTVSSTDTVNNSWTSTLRFGLTKESLDNRTWNSNYSSLQRSYLWQNDLTLKPGQQISTVLERLEERAVHSYGYSQDKRDTNSVGLIYRGDFGPQHVQANLRNDNITGYDDQASGGVSYDLDFTPNWSAGVSANTGFRAPTFSDLYYPREQYYWDGLPSGSFQGNPDLKPERSRNLEARLTWKTDDTRVGAVIFQNKVRDLINGYVCDSNFDCTAMNTDRATIRGLTLMAEHSWDNTTLRASADFLSPKDDETGNVLVRRARQVYRFNAEQRFDAVTMGAEWQFTGHRYDDIDNNRRLGGYGLLNFTASYALNRHATVQVRWDNALDKHYVNTYGFNTPGSTVFVNLALRM